MTARQAPENLFSSVADRYHDGEWPTREEIRALLGLCAHPREEFREAALALLFTPPVSDEPACFGRLLRAFADDALFTGPPPRALAEFLVDVLSFLHEMPSDPSLRALCARALARLGKEARLFSRALPLKPVFNRLDARALARPRGTAESVELKRCTRLLRKRIFAAPPAPPWAEWTTADLEPLRRQRGTSRNLRFRRARWLATLRPLLLPPSRPAPCGEGCPGRPFKSRLRIKGPGVPPSYWDGRGPAALKFLEALTLRQAEELRSIRDLAVEVGRTTRRVVLSWHNASLAAAGGWAFEHLAEQFPSTRLFEEFRKKVLRRADEIEADAVRDPSTLQRLSTLREERLLVPKLTHALWESRIRAAMDAGRMDRWRSDLRAAAAFLEPEVLSEIETGGKYGWHGAVSPHQRVSVRDVSAWHATDRKRFVKGLATLAALAREGQKLLDAGLLDRFVLPWIDKFFISSRREADCEYLPALVDWIEARGGRPLFLFWEDTAHRRVPSFQIVLERLVESGKPFRGIGIFGDGTTDRKDAAAFILREHGETSLFALRPCEGTYDPRPLHQLLKTMDRGFLRAYDSSWKDGLCFLYTGTRVFPLLSVQCEAEPFAPWIAKDGARLPFGAAFRSALRREVLGSKRIPVDPLSLEYALRANLC